MQVLGGKGEGGPKCSARVGLGEAGVATVTQMFICW